MLGEDHITAAHMYHYAEGRRQHEDEVAAMWEWLWRVFGCPDTPSTKINDERPMATTDCIDYPRKKKALTVKADQELRWDQVEERSPTSILTPLQLREDYDIFQGAAP